MIRGRTRARRGFRFRGTVGALAAVSRTGTLDTATLGVAPAAGATITERILAGTKDADSGTAQVTSLSVSPSGQVQGDGMVGVLTSVGGTATHSAPDTNWVQVGGGTLVGSTTMTTVWRKLAGASEAGPYVFSIGATARRVLLSVRVWSGVDPTTFLDGVPQEVTGQQSGTITHANLTPAGVGRLHVLVTAKNTAVGVSSALTEPAGYTETADRTTAHATNANANHGVHYKRLTTADPTGALAVTSTDTAARQWAGLGFLITPAASGGGGPGSGIIPARPKIGHWRNRPNTDGALSWQQRYDAAVDQFGDFPGRRSQYKSAGAAGTLSAAELAAVDAGQGLHVYWKVASPWTNVTNGSSDTRLIAAAGSYKSRPDTTFWVTFWHEPENDLTANGGTAGTAAQFVSQWRYCVDLFRAQGVTNCKYAWVIMNSAAHPADLPSLWPGNSYVDLVGVQRYIGGSATSPTLGARFLTDLQWFTDNYAAGTRNWRPKKTDGTGDLPFSFTEWGADLLAAGARGTASHRATQIDTVTGILDDLAVWGVQELRMFDAGQNWLEDKPSVDAIAYQNLKDAAAQSSANPFPVTATVGLTV